MVASAVSIQYTSVTDRQTDRPAALDSSTVCVYVVYASREKKQNTAGVTASVFEFLNVNLTSAAHYNNHYIPKIVIQTAVMSKIAITATLESYTLYTPSYKVSQI